jgi:phosphatidylglycerophosphate synthase
MTDPGRWQTRANALTGARLLSAPVLALCIIEDAPWPATWIFAFAVATDFADGFVARRYDEASAFGRLLDHSVDAAFVTLGAAALAWMGALPALLPTLIAASFLQYALDSRAPVSAGPRPSSLGRWNGIAYYVIVATPIVRDALGLGWPSASLVTALGWLLVGSTLLSMVDRFRTRRATSP